MIHNDARGTLQVIDFEDDIPFSPKRFFVISNVPLKSERGNHAHKKTSQFLKVLSGSCTIEIEDPKGVVRNYFLKSETAGILQKPYEWGVMREFSPDCVLAVFADTKFDPSDYIYSKEDLHDKIP